MKRLLEWKTTTMPAPLAALSDAAEPTRATVTHLMRLNELLAQLRRWDVDFPQMAPATDSPTALRRMRLWKSYDPPTEPITLTESERVVRAIGALKGWQSTLPDQDPVQQHDFRRLARDVGLVAPCFHEIGACTIRCDHTRLRQGLALLATSVLQWTPAVTATDDFMHQLRSDSWLTLADHCHALQTDHVPLNLSTLHENFRVTFRAIRETLRDSADVDTFRSFHDSAELTKWCLCLPDACQHDPDEFTDTDVDVDTSATDGDSDATERDSSSESDSRSRSASVSSDRSIRSGSKRKHAN
jgi:hypothetical protein